MIDVSKIDFSNSEVQKALAECSATTGLSVEEIIEQYKKFGDKAYVIVVGGEFKGQVGYYYPSLYPFDSYAVSICTKNGYLWCPGWQGRLKRITKEEYEKAIKEQIND